MSVGLEPSFSYDIAIQTRVCIGIGVGNVCARRAMSYEKDYTYYIMLFVGVPHVTKQHNKKKSRCQESNLKPPAYGRCGQP